MMDRGLRVCFVTAVALAATLGVAAQVPGGRPSSASTQDGLLRSELSLGGRTATLAYRPALSATDAAHAPLLEASPRAPAGGRVGIGYVEATGPIQLGTVTLGATPRTAGAPSTPTPPPIRYELSLGAGDQGWQLHITDGANTPLGQVALSRQSTPMPSPMLTAALVAETTTTGLVVLQWAGYGASATIVFPSPTSRRLDENRTPNETINRRHDEDTSALSRARLLAQRSETAVVLPNGARMSLSFQRTFGRGERVEGNRGTRGLTVEGPDFARLMKTPTGDIVTLTESPVPRLRIERPLQFAKTTLATGNQVPGFAGSYGVWLKRAAGGWKLVFSHEPDVWGSQHDPKADAAEIEVTHSEGHAADRPFAAALMPTGPDRGRLAILWGPHEWTADFVVAAR